MNISSSSMSGNIRDYYIRRARSFIARDHLPASLPDAAAWRQTRPEVYRRYLTSLGLDRMPERGDLCATNMGTFEGTGYTGTKFAYQLMRDCWGSAHLYRPAHSPTDTLAPAVLYACGHAASGVISYHHHGIAWARRGYICLIFDTIQQHDNPGYHLGLHSGKRPDWISLGYTAAGGEVFNGMRALDLLLMQPGVDPHRIGVTGISGGGAQSFFLAAADDRIAAVASFCGISDPAYAIASRQVHQHCDCMYLHNLFAHDLGLYATLIAPRALLCGFARQDMLFTPVEYRNFYERVRQRYERLGCDDRCALYEYEGPHGYNHRDAIDTVHRWFDRHVAGSKHPEVDTLAIASQGELLDETTLSVFHGRTPEPNHLDLLPNLLSPKGQIDLPRRPEQWSQIKKSAISRLRHEVFHLLDDAQQPQQLELCGQWLHGHHRESWQGHLDGMSQSLLQMTPLSDDHQAVVIAVGERDTPVMPLVGTLWQACESHNVSVLGIEPRACGTTTFRETARVALNREGCLVGTTPTMMVVQDLHHLWPLIRSLPRVRNRAVYLYGKGEGAVAQLWHALLHEDEQVSGIILEDLPVSQTATTCQILGVLRVMDIPQAVGLLASVSVALVNHNSDPKDWYFADRMFGRVGRGKLTYPPSVSTALNQMLSRPTA